MPRPEIICHMAASLDGRLLSGRWPFEGEALLAVYEGTAERLEADGWIVGRVTMESFVPSGAPKATATPAPRDDLIAAPEAEGIAICFDRQARLKPESGEIDGDHLVLVLSQAASEDHVNDLVRRGVSVVFAGDDGNDISGALARIGDAFGARRLLLEGGGCINGAFLAAELIDETSTLVVPVIDGQQGIPAIYEHTEGAGATGLEALSSEVVGEGIVWLRHRVSRG